MFIMVQKNKKKHDRSGFVGYKVTILKFLTYRSKHFKLFYGEI